MKSKILVFFLLLILSLMVPTFIAVGEKDPRPEMEIYLVSNEIHIGIAVPITNPVFDWRPFVIDDYFPESKGMTWVEFGWGDRQFYFEMPTWDHFTLGLAADALFSPDAAVMHVGISESLPSAKRVKISYKTYEKIVKAIHSSFVLKDGKPILIPGRGYSSFDNFFEAHGSFSIVRTCNVWTSEIFAKAGLRRPLWSPTKYGLEIIWD